MLQFHVPRLLFSTFLYPLPGCLAGNFHHRCHNGQIVTHTAQTCWHFALKKHLGKNKVGRWHLSTFPHSHKGSDECKAVGRMPGLPRALGSPFIISESPRPVPDWRLHELLGPECGTWGALAATHSSTFRLLCPQLPTPSYTSSATLGGGSLLSAPTAGGGNGEEGSSLLPSHHLWVDVSG